MPETSWYSEFGRIITDPRCYCRFASIKAIEAYQMVDLKPGGHLKCPKKVCEGFILHVMAFVCFWTAPESVIFIFGFVLDFKSITFFLLVKPFFMFENLEMLHFPIWFWKKGTLSLWKQERNWKWIWSISGHFKNKFKCYHIQNISSTYFCRISSNPPLLLNCRVLIWPDFD